MLRSEDDPDHRLLNELRKIFWKLHTSHLPVDPLGLTDTFGWGTKEINEAQDWSEFWRKFIERIENTTLSKDSTSLIVGGIRTSYRETGAREESFYGTSPSTFAFLASLSLVDMQIDAVNNPRLEDALNDYFTPWGENQNVLLLTQLPEVLILCVKFFYYDLATDSMKTVSHL